MTKNLSPLPAKYWNFSDSYSAATDNAMKATVPNPFLSALPAIQASNPALYNYLSNVGMFTGPPCRCSNCCAPIPTPDSD